MDGVEAITKPPLKDTRGIEAFRFEGFNPSGDLRLIKGCTTALSVFTYPFIFMEQ
jgi:hypothetical protein